MMSNNTPVSYIGKHTFTAEEKDAKLQQMLAAMRAKEEIEAEFKTTKSNYKSKIDAKEGEIKLTSNLLNAGWEDRTYSCNLVKNFDTLQREYYEIGTGTLVGTEPLTAADHQMQMNLQEAEIKFNNEAADMVQEDVTEKLEEAGFKIVPIDSIAHLQDDEEPVILSPEEIEAAERGPITEEPTPTESPEATIETLKTKPLKNEKEVIIEPTTDELEADPFGDDEGTDDDPFNFEI